MVLKYVKQPSDYDMAFRMFETFELIIGVTDTRYEADNEQKSAQRRYEKDRDRRVRFCPISHVCDYFFLAGCSFFGRLRNYLPQMAIESFYRAKGALNGY